MKKAIAILFLASACFAQSAQTPPTPASMAQRRVDRLTKVLGLSSTQAQQALTIFTNAATADATIRASLKTERQSLASAVQANSTTNIQTAATQIGILTGQMVQSEATANAAFYQILTPAQQTQYTNLQSRGGMNGPGFRGRRP
jgi:Spy/CpxP family protein refolding chaperone